MAPLVLTFLGFDHHGPSTIYNSVYNGVLTTSPMFLMVLFWEYEHLKGCLSFVHTSLRVPHIWHTLGSKSRTLHKCIHRLYIDESEVRKGKG